MSKVAAPKEPPTTPSAEERVHPLREILFSEGGLSLLFIFPIVVYFFLAAAISSI